MKTGVLLLNLGGPDSLEAVKPFLYNLFSDPDIIKLPLSNLFQKPLAQYISSTREKEAQENYRQMGGCSPILPLTQEQAQAIQAALAEKGHPVRMYIAMRYWHPFTEEAVAKIKADGIERLIILPLYPHFSYTTTGSSLNELRREMEKQGLDLPVQVVSPYYNHPLYLGALAETIEEGLSQHPWECPKEKVQVLFSAHSLPQRHVERTQDPYPEHIFETATLVMKQYFPEMAWELSYQSKVGKMPWLAPSVEDVLHFFAGKRIDNILVVPVSFVSDHVETRVEIDIQYKALAHELGIRCFYRAPVFNSRSRFITAMVSLIEEKLHPWDDQPEAQDFNTLLAAVTPKAEA